MGVLTWSPLAWGFLSGRFRKDREVDLGSGRPALRPDRFDPAAPGNAAKLDVVEKLVVLADELGCTLPQLATAFPLVHPVVTSVILGPRTMEQLQNSLAGADVVLDDSALERIDAIVAPGTELAFPDGGWSPPSLTETAARRRPAGDRPAGA
jgi:aryl-alcohol dehydrogenase-like predicted oxidoreductase